MPAVEVGGNEISYRDVGAGPVLFFVHGVFVNGHIWDEVVEELQTRFRCITPDLPLGGHASPVRPHTDLSPMATAALIPAFLEALRLDDVTVVANDTGSGLTLVALDCEEPGLRRIGRLVLTNGDSYQHFPPGTMRGLVLFARYGSALAVRLLGRMTRRRRFRERFTEAVSHRTEVPPAINDAFDQLANIGVRRDAVRFLGGLHRSVTLDAAHAIDEFEKPVLLAWGRADRNFPVAHARRLAEAFPRAVLIEVPGSKGFVMLDAPARLAQLITEFVNPRTAG
jgi:pimeloyl-ACP methyl ester carboxylesterase